MYQDLAGLAISLTSEFENQVQPAKVPVFGRRVAFLKPNRTDGGCFAT